LKAGEGERGNLMVVIPSEQSESRDLLKSVIPAKAGIQPLPGYYSFLLVLLYKVLFVSLVFQTSIDIQLATEN